MASDPAWKAYEKARPLVVPRTLAGPHPVTTRMASQLASGALDCQGDGVLRMHVHPASLDRALRIADTLLKGFGERGFTLRYQDAEERFDGLAVCIEDEAIELALWEAMGDGKLALLTDRRHGRGLQSLWRDLPLRRLEGQLNRAMLGLRGLAAARRTYRLWTEEIDRRVEAFDRERAELADRVATEQRAVDRLSMEVANWQHAQTIRAYIAAVEAQPSSQRKRKQRTQWAAWAHEQADRLDPLRPSPPSILDTPESAYRPYGPLEELPEALFDFEVE